MNPKIWRENRKLSLAGMGDLIGKTAPAIQRYERGERFPDPETIAAYGAATNGAVGYADFLAVRENRRQALDPAVTAGLFRKKQTGTRAKTRAATRPGAR